MEIIVRGTFIRIEAISGVTRPFFSSAGEAEDIKTAADVTVLSLDETCDVTLRNEINSWRILQALQIISTNL